MESLTKFTQGDNHKLTVITTTYMGATDFKAIKELGKKLRLYTELKRLSDSVLIKDEDNLVSGFEFNGSYISFDGDEINVHTQTGKNKKYLSSHLLRSMKATFNEIKDDVGCIEIKS